MISDSLQGGAFPQATHVGNLAAALSGSSTFFPQATHNVGGTTVSLMRRRLSAVATRNWFGP
jgi:hypothetical protein